MSDARITATENGPYKVQGDFELVDQDGNPIETTRSTIFLCRCGGSTNKPFCDGTHSKIGFRGARQAVLAEEGDVAA
ncbi:MAG TPA: CDGSH iron-sulfur domain-containing protein [Solirubrobacteraceae bacterium]|nr:CDGSH iron-sulfur domain-containing protein [Solirubrobacteraceae bacterium]